MFTIVVMSVQKNILNNILLVHENFLMHIRMTVFISSAFSVLRYVYVCDF